MNNHLQIKQQTYEFIHFVVHLLFDDSTHICVLMLNGSMDTQSVWELQKTMKEIIQQRSYNYIVDLAHVTHMSSTGLGLLMSLARYKKNYVLLSYPREAVLQSFKLLGITDLFQFYRGIDELERKKGIPINLVTCMKDIQKQEREIQYSKRWVKILRDYMVHTEVMEEIKKMSPYITQADHDDIIVIPCEEKYACILYKFLDRIFTKTIKGDGIAIDDFTTELIAKELMTNAVRHGYNYQKGGIVEAYYKVVDDEKIEIYIIDYGRGFSSSIIYNDSHVKAGLKLIEKIFDEVSIDTAPKKKGSGLILGEGATIKMVKYLKASK